MTIVPNESEPYEPPSYSDPGDAIIIVHGPYHNTLYSWDIDVLSYDNGAAPFWINEGEGFEYWCDNVAFPGPGVYVIRNIKGTYYKGDWGYEDDDVEWEWDLPVPARFSDMDVLLTRLMTWKEFLQWLFWGDPVVSIETAMRYYELENTDVC